ncbi:MAG: DUF4838 domain-containing protein [Kiritimatiellia bacterium]
MNIRSARTKQHGFALIKVWVVVAIIAILASLLLIMRQDGDLVIVDNGQSDYVIVGSPGNPAVRDLQDYITKMTGVQIPVMAKESPLPLKAIILRTDHDETLPPQAYRLRVVKDRIEIQGADADGLSHGVYGLLDDHWGCRFLTPDAESVPRHQVLSLPGDLDKAVAPSIRDRGFIGAAANHQDWLRRNRVSAEIDGTAVHDIYQWLPPKTHVESHPEWYPLNDKGVREPKSQWLCWTNEEMVAELTGLVKSKMAESPADRYISIGQGDGFSAPCHCDTCRAVVDRYGSESAPIVHAVNRILGETSKDFPEHEIVIFAYVETLHPPIKGTERLEPHKNLCLTFVRMGDAMKPITSESNEGLRKAFLGWRSLTDNLQIWSWSVGFNRSICPFPNYKVMAGDTQWFAPHVHGFHHQTYGMDAEWGELRQWLFARLMWNAELDVEEVEQEFIRKYYGAAAAEHMWGNLDKMQQKAALASDTFNAVYHSDPKNVRTKLFPDEDMRFYMDSYQMALEAAASSEFAERVQKTFAHSFAFLEFAEARQKQLRPVSHDGRDWVLPEGDTRLAEPLMLLADLLKTTRISEWGNQMQGRRNFLANAGSDLVTAENDKLELKVSNIGMDGVLLSLVDKSTGTELLHIGPPGKGHLSGIHHSVNSDTGSGLDHSANREKLPQGGTKITAGSSVPFGAWQVVEAFRHQRVFELPEDRRGFTMTSYLYPDPEHRFAWRFKVKNNTILSSKYASTVRMRLASVSAEPPTLAFESSEGVQRSDFATEPLFAINDPQGEVKLNLSGIVPDGTLLIRTPGGDWTRVEAEWNKTRTELNLKFIGKEKSVSLGNRTQATKFELDITPGGLSRDHSTN